MTFETSEGRSLGPFGGDGGSKNDLTVAITKYREEGGTYDNNKYKWNKSIVPGPHTRIPLDSCLVGITGNIVTTGGDFAITHLRFIFRQMLPSSDFLINSEKKCERHMPFSNGSRLSPDSYDDYYDDDDDDYDDYDDYDGYDGYDGYDDSYHGYEFDEYDDDLEGIF